MISADSLVAGSSSVVISGLQTNLGSDLQLPPSVFLDASRLLRDELRRSGAPARAPASPAAAAAACRPHPTGRCPRRGRRRLERSALADGGPVFLDACAGTLVRETNS